MLLNQRPPPMQVGEWPMGEVQPKLLWPQCKGCGSTTHLTQLLQLQRPPNLSKLPRLPPPQNTIRLQLPPSHPLQGIDRITVVTGLSYYHPTGCHPPVGGMVRIRLICWLVLFSPCKLVTREVGDFKNPEAGVLFSPGQILLHQVTW